MQRIFWKSIFENISVGVNFQTYNQPTACSLKDFEVFGSRNSQNTYNCQPLKLMFRS